jgi:hypothetical protein
VTLKYNKNYIGLARGGLAFNFVSFRPRRQHVVAEFKIPPSEDLTERLTDAGIEVLTYRSRWGQYQMQLLPGDVALHKDLLLELIATARKTYAG